MQRASRHVPGLNGSLAHFVHYAPGDQHWHDLNEMCWNVIKPNKEETARLEREDDLFRSSAMIDVFHEMDVDVEPGACLSNMQPPSACVGSSTFMGYTVLLPPVTATVCRVVPWASSWSALREQRRQEGAHTAFREV